MFAFDKSESFAIDKAAGEECPNLGTQDKCRIFDSRTKLGFAGCVSYNCFGAGQRVTQEIFNGKSWRENSQLKQQMGSALSVLRRIHEQLSLLRSSKTLPLSLEERNSVEALENELSRNEKWTEEDLQLFPIEQREKEVFAFLSGLRRHVV